MNKKNNNFNLSIKKLTVSNPDLSVKGSLSIHDNQIGCDLVYDLTSKIVPKLDEYLPRSILDESVIHWLTGSIKSFDDIKGYVQFHQNKLSMPLSVHNLNLQYDPRWPPASNVNVSVTFTDKDMNAFVNSGQLLKTPIKDIFVSIPDWTNAVLNIHGQVSDAGKNMLEYVNQSPLQKTVGKYFQFVDLGGNVLLNLDIQIPLTNDKAISHVNGAVRLSQNSAKISNDTNISNIEGDIIFNENGITGKMLKGVLWNKPIKGTISASKYLIEYPGWNIVVNQTGSNGFRASVNNQTASGYLQFNDKKIVGRFRYLTLGKNQNKNTNDKNNVSVRPEKIPALDIVIDQFSYRDKNFGAVNIKTSSLKSGLKLDSLKSNLDSTAIQMTGLWNNRQSSVSGVLSSKDSAKTLRNWRFSDSLQTNSLKVDYQLNWQGALYSPDLKTLSGNARITAGAGALQNVGSRAKNDLGRLLTILSFQSIAKRMQLDFSDFAKSGLSFDSITGNFVLSRGVVSTNNLVIEGSVATIEMKGSIDLANETYQLKFIVTPHITASLPVVATLAGGPVAGAAAWAAGKIINPLLNKITSDIYTVTGSWDNPVIK